MNGLSLDFRLTRGRFELALTESLAPNGITVIFGANGSGKTTLLRVIAGLERDAIGSVRFREACWQQPGNFVVPEQRRIGYVFQEGRLFPHLSVSRNLGFAAARGTGTIGIDDVVRLFELEPLLDRLPAGLSGGERQRVAIARALASNPQILLMDEPLSAIDIRRRRELLPLIHRLPTDFGIPVVYVTHDLDELVYLADDVLLLSGGACAVHGSVREVFRHRDFGRLAESGSAGSVLETQVAGQTDGLTRLTLPGGDIFVPHIGASAGTPVRLRISPRDVILALEPVTGISIRNCLAARVVAVEPDGDSQCIVVLAVGDQQLKARITEDAARDLDIRAGLGLYALIKTVALDGVPPVSDGPPKESRC